MPTSTVLPPEEFPQFAQRDRPAATTGVAGGAFEPVEGDWYVGAVHADDSYMRLARTVDLTGVDRGADAGAGVRSCRYDTEPDYDNVIVEAHTRRRRTTGRRWPRHGGTSTAVPADCEQGFLLESTRSSSTT